MKDKSTYQAAFYSAVGIVIIIVFMMFTSCSKVECEEDVYFYAITPYKIELVSILDPTNESLKYMDDSSIGDELCESFGTGQNELFWMEASTFENSNYLFKDRDGKEYADSGWYSNGIRKFYWDGIHLARVYYCNE